MSQLTAALFLLKEWKNLPEDGEENRFILLESEYNQFKSTLDEEDMEDYQALDYIKERVSFWKKELFKAEEKEFFFLMNKELGIE